MPNPRDALDQQELLRGYLSRPGYIEYLQRFSESVVEKKGVPIILGSDGKPDGRILADEQQEILRWAETYYVSDDMGELAEYASLGLDDLDRFTHDLWPTDYGFLWFQKTIPNVDVWGKSMPFRALAWRRRSYRGHPGMYVFIYTDLADPNDHLAARMSEEQRDRVAADMGRIHLAHMLWLGDEQRVGPKQWEPPAEYQQYAMDPVNDVLTTMATSNDRFVLALLMLLNQTVTVKTRHDLKPRNPKHARKMKIPGMVTVITLRRAKNPQHAEGGHLEFSYRFPVRGHWRNQVCGPDYPLAQEIAPGQWRARIFIAMFMKGDPSLPLHITRKVQALTR